MATITNIAKGQLARFARLPETNDSMIAVLLKVAQADSALQDYADLAALLAGGNTEAAFTGYSRLALANLTVTVDNTANKVVVDCDDVQWSPTSTETMVKILFCYDADTTSGTDADIIPVFIDDFAMASNEATLTYQVAAGGFYVSM